MHMSAGELVICEEAAMIGPANDQSCLECLALTTFECPKCHFNLCENCLNHDLTRHDSEECLILEKVQNPDIPGLYNLVFPLRFLRLKSANPELFERLVKLEGHMEIRQLQVIKQRESL
jgi:hypothetical protein